MADRIARRELKLIAALDEAAFAADNITSLTWFKQVLQRWIRPQSMERKHHLKSVFAVAARAIDLENTNRATPEQAREGFKKMREAAE
jgi:uncharacterized protein HemY